MAAQPKRPVDEEAHFRIDEIERKLAEVPSADHIAGVAGGAASVLMAELKRDIADIRAEMLKDRAPRDEDIALDREVIESNKGTQAACQEVCMCLKELIQEMRKPRELTAQLPSG